MMKVMKYKWNYLLSNRLISYSVIILFLVLNFEAVINSGVLFSGGSDFNTDIKYELLMNNWNIVSTFYGLLLSIYLGASMIGLDMQTGNLYILLSAYPSRKKYFLGTLVAVFLFSTVLQILLMLNVFILFALYQIKPVWQDVWMGFGQNYLNTAVTLSVTGLASVYVKGHGSAVIGLLGYCYFNAYMYNTIPFLNTTFLFDVTKYKNILCHLFPITNVLAPSYTDADILAYYHLKPALFNIYGYQILFVICMIAIGCFCIEKKEL